MAGPAASQVTGREAYDRLLSQPGASPLGERVTGVVVPHHAPALALAALAFSLAGGREIDRVIILCPDHYRQSRTPFATTDRDFRTPYGPVRADQAAVAALASSPQVGLSDLFDNEHGVNILLPLVAAFFPRATVVPVAARITATPAECERLADLMAPLMTPETLVVLSADFSHRQPGGTARQFDQQSLCALAQDDPKAVLSLRQPENVDTVAMLYVQALLQKRLGAPFTALANQDTAEVLGRPVSEATSYLAGVWGPRGPVPAGGKRLYFAGDTFFGRALGAALAQPARRAALVRRALEYTGGAELVVNLEGVLARGCPPPAHDRELCMDQDLAIEMLKALRVRAVGLANNHAMDLGGEAYSGMKRALTQEGFAVLEKNTVTDLGTLRVAAFTDLENGRSRAETAINGKDMAVLDAVPRDKPLAAFVHWGREFQAEPDPRQWHLYDALRDKGAALVVGAHPHVPGPFSCGEAGCMAASLGNFVFDQRRNGAGGMLLEVTVFRRGTWFAKPIPIGNLGGELLQGR
jgi:poly-gamma-glutamate synthesis protein (capsule biosynthesis protein)